MTAIRTYAANAYESTLSSSLGVGATTINVVDTTGSPAVPFYLTLEPANDDKREIVLVNAKTSTTFTLSSSASRGMDGTTDVAHDSGSTVKVVPVAAVITDLHDRVDDVSTTATAAYGPGDTVPVADGGTGATTAAAARTNLAAASTTHAATHSNGGTDEITVENLGTAATDTALVLKPDGAGGVAFGAGAATDTPDFTTAEVATFETTTSTSYADLATVGPTVTVTVPASGKVMVLFQSDQSHNTVGGDMLASFAVSGANTLAADDARVARSKAAATNTPATITSHISLTGLAAGSTTFTAKYRQVGGTATYGRRRITVVTYP